MVAVIFIAPILAAVLLWSRYRRAGAWLLFASMTGSLVFGLEYHFLIPGADNVFTLQPGAWRTPFQVSAALLLLLQGIGSVVGVWALNAAAVSTGAQATVGLSGTRWDFRKELR